MSAPAWPRRTAFLKAALGFLGAPYLWGGRSWSGIDCSGLVTVALHAAGGPDWRATHNTDTLWGELAAVDLPAAGDLVFYGGSGPDDVEHVMIHLALGMVFGASGGGRHITDLVTAQKARASVKVFETIPYRPDLRGFRTLPLTT